METATQRRTTARCHAPDSGAPGPSRGAAIAVIALAFLAGVLAAQRAEAQTFTTLYTFTHVTGSSDGAGPAAPLIMDKAGNLFGTTSSGGPYGYGTVFKLDTSGHETVLHSFTGGSDGANPFAGLIMDAAGNLYGTTLGGGLFNCHWSGGDARGGCGTVFKFDPSGNETVLYAFKGWTFSDGAWPYATLIIDAAGNLYGTTEYGGEAGCVGNGCGVVFKLDPSGMETVLYRFTGTMGNIPMPA